VCAALTDAPVSAGVLAPVKLVEAAVHADHEHIQIRQQNGQLVAPALLWSASATARPGSLGESVMG
jgi:hypothetical protein